MIVSLTADQKAVPFVDAPPYAYTGNIVAVCEGRTRHVPFAFIKAAQLTVRTDLPGFIVLVHDGTSIVWSGVSSDTTFRVFVGPGTYDIMAKYGLQTVIREGVVVADSAVVSVRTTDATYAMQWDQIGEHGQSVYTDLGVQRLYHRPTGIDIVVVRRHGLDPVLLAGERVVRVGLDPARRPARRRSTPSAARCGIRRPALCFATRRRSCDTP